MQWVVQRVIETVLLMLAITVLAFVALNAIGNPVDLLMAPGADAQDRARFIEQMGLNLPLWQQYLHFVFRALQGDLGRSFVYNIPAFSLIGQRVVPTVELAMTASLLSLGLGLPLGLYCGLRPRGAFAKLANGVGVLGFSLPTFWVGMILILFFSVKLGWLPSSGRGETRAVFGIGFSFLTWDGLRHLLLPAMNLSLFQASLLFRLTRAHVMETLHQEYIRFARARGLPMRRIVGVHLLRVLAAPVLTAAMLEVGATVAFSVVTETIFAWPGVGKLIIDSINMVDRPVIVAYLMLVCVFFLSLNLSVDLLCKAVDPRTSGGMR